MAGQNAQKVKVKTTKELTDEVKIFKNGNKMLAEQVKELDKIVKDAVKQLMNSGEQLKGPTEVPNVTKTFKFDNCEQTFLSKKSLKEHRKDNHKQNIKCKYCDENFSES